MPDFLVASPWPGMALLAVLSLSDYYLTISSARLYRERASEIIVFEGSFELTPAFQDDIDNLRMLSPRLLAALVWPLSLLLLIWLIASGSPSLLHAYELGLGAVVLIQCAVHIRHLRNYTLFRSAFGPGGVTGRVEYPRTVILSLSAYELFTFSGLFLFLSILTQSWFLFGGVLSCSAVGFRHRGLARAHLRSLEVAAQREDAADEGIGSDDLRS